MREAVAAQQLDERATKAEVIETYLNSVFYGNQAYGAEAASQRYFGRSAKSLTSRKPRCWQDFLNPPLRMTHSCVSIKRRSDKNTSSSSCSSRISDSRTGPDGRFGRHRVA